MLAALSGCGGGGSSSSAPTVPSVAASPTPASDEAGKIKHVVVIVQENRSFDNLFYGYPGANTATTGLIKGGGSVPLHEASFYDAFDLSHVEADYIRSYDGGAMDGFNLGSTGGIGLLTPSMGGVPKYPQYSYVDPSQTSLYVAMAHSYVLADAFFTSQIDSSFTAHQYMISAQAAGTVDTPSTIPWGCDAPAGTLVPTLEPDRSQGPGIVPCFGSRTLGDELDAKGAAWRYYAPAIGGNLGQIWSAYDAIKQVRYGADWTADVISPETKVLTDVPAGTLAAVTWVVPDFANSDHPGSKSATGPDWVASVVDAIGESPFWASTAIFVYWDDWGGLYDHVAPPQLGPGGLGFRTPLLVISPYAKRDYVSHVQYESTSVVKFIETTFGLPTLTTADARAANFDDSFDFTKPPRAFVPFATRIAPSALIRRQPSSLPPDTD